jgi:cbb3-type cytochrome oxidase cytochrome c subunit
MDCHIPFVVDFTTHAAIRMQQRRISETAVVTVLMYGREVYIRGACVCVLGHKQIVRCLRHGLDLSAHAGVHVVLSTDGAVLTVYRNADLRGLRPRGRRHCVRRAG